MKRALLILLATLLISTGAGAQTPEPEVIVSQWECGWQTFLLVHPPDELETTEGLIIWELNGNENHPYGQDLVYRGRMPSADQGEVEVWTSHIGAPYEVKADVIYLQAGGFYYTDLPQPFDLACEQDEPSAPALFLPVIVN